MTLLSCDTTGCLAIIIALVIPPYLNIVSRQTCQKKFGRVETPYSMGVVSSPAVSWCILIVGSLMFTSQIITNVWDALVK